MDKHANQKPVQAFVSPYLTVPPRSLEQALRERQARPAPLAAELPHSVAAAVDQGQP